jgi:chromosome partitioning protein
MRSIAVINQKGGVGKTTTAVNVSAGLVRAGRRVLLVDLDPQAHASLHVGIQLGRDDPSIYDVLVRRLSLAQVCLTIGDGLSLVPAGIDLVGADLELREQPDRDRILADALRPFHDTFDFCIVDCPPALGLLTVNALAAVRELLIPLQPHFLGLQGLGRLLETIMLVRQVLNADLRVAGVVLCMYEGGTRLAQEVRDDITQFLSKAEPSDAWYGARVFETRIRRNIKLAECPSFGQTVFDYAPDSHGAEDYGALAREILGLETGPAGLVASAAEHPDASARAAGPQPPAPCFAETRGGPAPAAPPRWDAETP